MISCWDRRWVNRSEKEKAPARNDGPLDEEGWDTDWTRWVCPWSRSECARETFDISVLPFRDGLGASGKTLV